MTNATERTVHVHIESEDMTRTYIILSESTKASALKDGIGLFLAALVAAIDAEYLQTGTLAVFCGMLAAILIGGKITHAICKRTGWEDSRMYLTKPQFVTLCQSIADAHEDM